MERPGADTVVCTRLRQDTGIRPALSISLRQDTGIRPALSISLRIRFRLIHQPSSRSFSWIFRAP